MSRLHATGAALLALTVLATPADGKRRKHRAAGPLVVATEAIDESALLDVGVELLGLGVTEEEPEADSKEIWRSNPDIRQAEAVFIPYHLRNTLESTGFWGAVRVIPPGTHGLDLTVSGRIVKTTPLELVVDIDVVDSLGRVWRRGSYRHEIDHGAYPDPVTGVPRREPYQPLYDRIANDLLSDLRRVSTAERQRIRETAEMRFAADISPELFTEYLRSGRDGTLELARLPAEGDPMFERLRRIRERDHMVVDTLNEHYASFYDGVADPYWEWRQFSQQEFLAWKKVRRQARTRKILGGLLIVGGIVADEGNLTDAAVIGGAGLVHSGVNRGREAKIHREALGELATSFRSEVSPMWIEVEGRTLKLEGTAREKYAQWRDLLREIFAEETGFEDEEPDESAKDFAYPRSSRR